MLKWYFFFMEMYSFLLPDLHISFVKGHSGTIYLDNCF